MPGNPDRPVRQEKRQRRAKIEIQNHGKIRLPAPEPREHTREVLFSFGLTEEDISALGREGVVAFS